RTCGQASPNNRLTIATTRLDTSLSEALPVIQRQHLRCDRVDPVHGRNAAQLATPAVRYARPIANAQDRFRHPADFPRPPEAPALEFHSPDSCTLAQSDFGQFSDRSF